MAVVDIKNLEGKNVGQIDLPDSVFKAKVNPDLLHETVRWYQAAQRAGTHKTKGRGEVSGSGKKLWKQKGTGRARVGSIRSSIWRKGGTVHGPVPRSYAYKLPRKMVLCIFNTSKHFGCTFGEDSTEFGGRGSIRMNASSCYPENTILVAV
jgi:large subunit ribosomal protein L4